MTDERILAAAVEAAARNLWERQRGSLSPSANKPWEDLHPMAQLGLRENVLSIVVAALEAVEPVMKHEAWAEGHDAGPESHALFCECPNPYPEVIL